MRSVTICDCILSYTDHESLLVCEFAGTVERQNINGAISGVLNPANEQANQNATHSSSPDRNNVSESDAVFANLVAAKDKTSYRKSGGNPRELPVITEAGPPAVKEPAVKDGAAASDLKDNTSGGPMRKLSRQFSKDSQRSGNTCMQNSFILHLPLAKTAKYQSSFRYSRAN